eukprot:TRINITY_DN9591_c0_g1_i1.p1 TRINITY_DN9591_c0_g1~~TRINITY_DN9591_c0_g1_i1.p1  ORF type:complete len:765 (-),score=156.91 TRINITY_DN9591_c0_g1_i1:19-2313(-)
MNYFDTFDYEENWDVLKNGLIKTFTLVRGKDKTGEKLPPKLYSTMHNIVYTWFTQPTEEKKMEFYRSIEILLSNQASIELLEFNIETSSDVLLAKYLDRFECYTATTKIVNNILRYMHRYWVQSQITAGEDTVREIFPLSLVVWRNTVFTKIKDRLMRSLLDMINRNRNGDREVDLFLIKNVLLSYVKIGVIEEDPVNFYKAEFEEEFVKTTGEFYKQESDEFIANNSVADYMAKAQSRLEHEENFAKQYLISCTFNPVVNICQESLIQSHMQSLQSEFFSMLDEDQYENMTRFFGLLSRLENGLADSSSTFLSYIVEKGKKLMSVYSSEMEAKKDIKQCLELISALLKFFEHYNDMLTQCFSRHALFVQSMDEGCKRFLNDTKIGSFSISEVLNFYVDGLLRGTEKLQEDQMDERLESCVRLFTYFDEKDIFYLAFKKSLGRRLLAKNFNEDAERNFIGKLKRECGDVHTTQYEVMFNDIKASNERKSQYKEWQDPEKSPVDMTVNVLNKLYWPLSKAVEFTLPKELQFSIKSYEKFYTNTVNKDHKLSWVFNEGNVLLSYTFQDEKKNKKKIELNVSCMQASILLMYNEGSQYTSDQIREQLGVSPNVYKMSLQPIFFTKHRLLANRGPDGKGKPKVNGKTAGMKELNGDDILKLIPLRNMKKKRLVYPQTAKNLKNKVDESKSSIAKINEERGAKIELAIVRVMKSRNVMDTQELIGETINILTKHFKPEPRMIKHKIESLMERDYLERDDNNQRLIRYKA